MKIRKQSIAEAVVKQKCADTVQREKARTSCRLEDIRQQRVIRTLCSWTWLLCKACRYCLCSRPPFRRGLTMCNCQGRLSCGDLRSTLQSEDGFIVELWHLFDTRECARHLSTNCAIDSHNISKSLQMFCAGSARKWDGLFCVG